MDKYYKANFASEDLKKGKPNYILHIMLFIITFITTTIAGVDWVSGKIDYIEITELARGLPYSISVLFILTLHEFGHYFAARYHKVDATLPFYIPFPPLQGFLNFGTFGAVIKTKSEIKNNVAMFDIGAAGPIAGFFASLCVLIYGFSNLPGPEYILNIHPDYFSPNYPSADSLHLELGDSILFAALREFLTGHGDFVPPMSEIYHYPYLLVGWFGLFITAMNLIPVGQLDGGHIVYSMFGGKTQSKIAWIILFILSVIGFLGISDLIFENFNFHFGWSGWLLWALILLFFIKPKHPEVREFYELNDGRKIAGFFCLLIFILSFTPTPFYISF